MSYQLHITSTAEHDIMRAVDYIEFVLKNPQAADNLLDTVTKQIGTLSDFPQKFHIVDDPVLASWEIRFIIINNYLAFYTINEEKQTVTEVRFLYMSIPLSEVHAICYRSPHNPLKKSIFFKS